MAVARIVEDVDELPRRVIDVRVDLRLHVHDGGGIGKLTLVGVVAREGGTNRARPKRHEQGHHHQDHPQHPPTREWLAQMQVSADSTAA